MPGELVETVRDFAFEGLLPTWALVAVGVALAALTLVLSWRQCRAGRLRLLPVLILPRLAAVAVVLWMLAEPTALTTVKQTHRKSVSILADASASMDLVDASQEGPDLLRWAAFRKASAPAQALESLDGAAWCLAAGQEMLAALSSGQAGENQQARNLSEVKRLLAGARERLDRLAGDSSVAGPTRTAIEDLRSALGGVVVPVVDGMAEEAAKGPLADRAAGLEPVQQTLAELAATAERAADDFAGRQRKPDSPDLRQTATLTRRQKCLELLESVERSDLGPAANKADVLRYLFNRDVYNLGNSPWAALPAGPNDGREVTDLVTALERVEQDASRRTLGAVVLLTDGGHNTDRDPLKIPGPAGAPLYIVPVGDTSFARDVALHHVQAPQTVLRNDQIVIEAMLDAYECAGEQVRVQLLEGDRVLEERKVLAVNDAFFTPLTFQRKAETVGTVTYRLQAVPVSRERTDENNAAAVTVDVTEGRLRVLLADGVSRWEFRYLRNLLRRDERMEFKSVLFDPPGTIETGSAKAARTAVLPASLDEWDKFTAVILGDLFPQQLTPRHQQQLQDYVGQRGGTLVLIAGDEAMPAAYLGGPLAGLLPVDPENVVPVDPQGYQLLVTSDGRASNVTQLDDDPVVNDRVWRGQLPVFGLSPYAVPRPASQVLIGAVPVSGRANGAALPAFLCWQRYGNGRVAYLSAPVTHRLRHWYGDRYHYRFWGQLFRWAASRNLGSGSGAVRLLTDKRRYQQGEDVTVEVQLRQPGGASVSGAQVSVAASRQGVQVSTVPLKEQPEQPGVYRATLQHLPIGQIILSPSGASIQTLQAGTGQGERVEAQIVVDPPVSPELRQTRCNLPLLQKLARASGGAIVKPTALPTVLSMLNLEPEITQAVRREALWPRWGLFMLFLGCLSVEWVVRKLVGLA